MALPSTAWPGAVLLVQDDAALGGLVVVEHEILMPPEQWRPAATFNTALFLALWALAEAA